MTAPDIHPWHADGLSCIVLGLKGDMDALNVALDSMPPQELRYVAQAATNVALYALTGGGVITPTPGQLDTMISGLQAQIAAMRAQTPQVD